jgi:NTP pyrophosphatase (non-canonical NTP hydrolase)
MQLTLEHLVTTSHSIAEDKGFHEQTHPNFSEKLLLIVSEIIELQEADRKEHGKPAELEELADIFIRLGDFCGIFYDWKSVENAIEAKFEKNRQRAYRHGCLY